MFHFEGANLKFAELKRDECELTNPRKLTFRSRIGECNLFENSTRVLVVVNESSANDTVPFAERRFSLSTRHCSARLITSQWENGREGLVVHYFARAGKPYHRNNLQMVSLYIVFNRLYFHLPATSSTSGA